MIQTAIVATLLGLLGQASSEQTGLTLGGLVIMTVSIGLVVGLMIFCIYRMLREPNPSEHHHAPLDIDTHDTET